MPQRFWSHVCPGYGQRVKSTDPTCRLCGAEGEDAGWYLSTFESMARFVRLYRLKPIGPHRPMTRELFDPVTRHCPLCHGRGLAAEGPPERWTRCLACDGVGIRFTVTDGEREAIRQRILAAYPEAEVRPT
jgi:hypothetical protein